MSRVNVLRDEIAAISDRREELTTLSWNRDLTPTEEKEATAAAARSRKLSDELRSELDKRETERKLIARPTRAYRPNAPDAKRVWARPRRKEKIYTSLGQQLRDIAAASQQAAPPAVKDKLSKVAQIYGAATGAGAAVGADGGFLIEPTFTTQLLEGVRSESVLLKKCTKLPLNPDSDSLEAPLIDETSRAAGSRWGGVTVSRVGEGATATASRPKLRNLSIRLEDLQGIGYATERLLRDARVLERVFSQAFSEEMSYVVDEEILRGSGGYECIGIIGHGGTVDVGKETGQLAATLKPENVMKMWSRMVASSRANAEWFYSQDLEPELYTLKLQTGVQEYPVFMPPGGVSGKPYATIMGRPAQGLEQCSKLGTSGDIILGDFTQFIIVDKGGIGAAKSMHVRFVYGESTFRWTFSINGQPKRENTITPANGGDAQSPFITLVDRL